MNLFICFLAVRAIYFSLVGAQTQMQMQMTVEPAGKINIYAEVTVTCSTGNRDADSIEVQFGGTKCFRGCVISSNWKCKPLSDGCSTSADKTNLTMRFIAGETFNTKTIRCSLSGGSISPATFTITLSGPPTIERVSSQIKLAEGKDATLSCQVRSITTADVKWWFKDTVLKTTRLEASLNRFQWDVKYDLLKITAAAGGTYYCTANEVDEESIVKKSEDVQVIVVQPPSSVTLQNVATARIDVDQKPVIAANEQVTFNCQAVTAPDSGCKLSIYKSTEGSGDRVLLTSCESETCETAYLVDSETGVISISCEAENEATVFQKRPVKSNDYTFSIIRVPTSVEADFTIDGSSTLEAQENSSLTIRCKSKGAAIPAVVIELMQGETVFGSSASCTYQQTPSGKETNCAWEMAPNQIVRDYNQLYTCRSTHLDAIAKTDHLQIKFPATHIAIYPNSHVVTFLEKETIMVECRTNSANPPAEIAWTRDGQPYTDVRNTFSEAQYNGQITISSMQFEAVRNNDWNISCSISGTGKQEAVFIVVNYPPDLSISMSSDQPVLGDEITLTCEATNGKPNATTLTDLAYSWDKQDVGNDKNQWVNLDSYRTYVISNATLADNGLYRCTANSPQSGTNSVTQELRLRHKPILGSQHPNRVVLNAASCENNSEDNVCASVALNLLSEPPGIQCAWERDGAPVDGPENVLTQANQTHCILTITSPKSDRSFLGRYVLTATNEIGSSNFSIEVQLPGAPQKPADVSIRSTPTPISCTVEWTSGFSGGEQQTFHVSAVQAPPAARGTASLNQSTISLTVDDAGFGTRMSAKLRNLEPDTQYEIGVKAINNNPFDNESDTEWVTCKTSSMPKTAATIEKTGTKEDMVFIRFKGDQRLPSTLKTLLRFCNKASLECKNVSISGPTPVSLDVQLAFNDLIKQYSFDVLVLDDDDLVLAVPIVIPALNKDKLKQSGMQTEVLIGIAIGGIFIAVLFIACTIFMLRRKHAPNDAVRSARRSSSEDDQNQVNKPLMKDNGAIQQGSPRCYSDSARRSPNAGGNFKKTADFPGNKNKDNSSSNNNNNNHGATRNAKTSRSIDCEMADFDAKQALMKAHEAEREAELVERELKKDFQNPAFDSAEKQRDGHEDIMKAVFDVPNEKLTEMDNADLLESEEARSPKNKTAPANNNAGGTTPMLEDSANGGERLPGLEQAGEIPEYDTRYAANDAAKPVYVALNKNGVHASIV